MTQAAKMSKDKTPVKEQEKQAKVEKQNEKKLNKQLEASFPASDPLAITQPGGGVTGPDDI